MLLNKNLKQLFIQEVINCLAYFAPLTLIAIFLSNYQGLTAKNIAFVMLAGSIAARWGRIAISPILSAVPVHISITLLQLLGAIGYLLLFYSYNTFSALFAMVMIGLFYGNNSIFIRVLITTTFKSDKTESFNERFAWLHMATNIATCLGPLVFNLIYSHFNGEIAFVSMSVFMLAMSVYSYFQMRAYQIEKQNAWFASLFRLLIRNDLLPIYILMVILWFFYAQMLTFAPILLAQKYEIPNLVWIVAASNGIIIVLCSVYFNKKLPQFFPNVYIPILLAFILSCFGFTFLLLNNGVWSVMLGVGLITCAEIFFIPGFNVILSQKVSEADKVAIFAINSLFTGLGEGSGYYFWHNNGICKGHYK